ncbi:MAG: sortase [Clostridia bacterium]|nr:sortase [Clostridia bacterium]
MFNSKYSNVLTVVLVIVIIAILGLIGFLGYDIYKKYYIEKDAEDFMERYEEQIKNTTPVEENIVSNEIINTIIDPGNDTLNTTTSGGTSSGSSSNSSKFTYKGFSVLGTIEIPKTGIKYPVLNSYATKALETSVCYYYGPGLNEVGNTTIAGHNYRNGAFFGKNKQLTNGDIIYITDNSGKKVKYTIYKVYTTTPNDGNYLTRDTAGKREISLTTCTDDSKGRLIIWAKES